MMSYSITVSCNEQFFQNTINALQKYLQQCLDTVPSYIKITFAVWHLKALIYLEYQIGGTKTFEIVVKLYCH